MGVRDSRGRPALDCALCDAVARLAAVAVVIAVVGLAGAVTIAAAASRFGSVGETAGAFNEPGGIAVAQSSGEVYLVDGGNARVESWRSGGTFASAWGWGVADGASAFEICEALCVAGIAGGGGGQLGPRAEGVAVDNSLGLAASHVYVADQQNARVEEFAADGQFIATFGGEVNQTKDNTGGATQAEKNICTAASGDVCVAGVAGAGQGEFEQLGRNSIAVDSSGTVYVGDRERVQEFDASGAFVGEITLPVGTGVVESVVVDSSKALYVSMSGAEVTGVHKFEFCPGVCVGKEAGSPRDPGRGFDVRFTVGPADDLFVYDSEAGHIFEFAPGGEELLSLIEEGQPAGLAFGNEQNSLYVLHPGFVQVRPLPPLGPVVAEGSESAGALLPTSAVVSASINPEGPEATSYHFEYGTTAAYGASSNEEPLSGEPFEDHSVSAALSGLLPLTTYHFRVVVANAASQTTAGPDQTFTTLPAVGIESESVSQVTSTSARLATVLNTHGVETKYRFEYGPSTAYGEEAPVPDGDAGSSSTDAAFSLLVEKLTSGTVYHYRVVAHNTLGTVYGSDREFTTQSPEARGLIDDRAWEMVSPPEKHGVALEAIASEGGLIQAAEDGAGFAYIAKAPIDTEPKGNRTIANTQLVARRGPGGWSTRDVTTPHEEVVGLSVGSPSEYQTFSSDLSLALVEPFGATPLAASATERTPYRREPSGQFTPLVYPGNAPKTKFGGEEVSPGLFLGGVKFRGATADAKHVVVSSPVALTGGFASGGPDSLYEWSEGTLRLISVMPNKVPAAEEGLEAVLGRNASQVRNAISSDGNRVFFTAGEHLFVRDLAKEETAQVDLAMAGAKGGAGAPVFQIATASGDRLFFTDASRLTADATAKDGAPDLYMCDVKVIANALSCVPKDLTIAQHAGEPADIQGAVIGSDEGGTYVYFVGNGALAPGAATGDCTLGNPTQQPPDAVCNLYVHSMLTGKNTLIAVLSGRDGNDWGVEFGGANLGSVTARVSNNGEWLAFMSQQPLTEFNNRDAQSGALDQEVFVYNRSSSALRCVSCAASGARPSGVLDPEEPPGLLSDRPDLWGGEWLAGSIPGWTRVQIGRAYYQSRYLSDTGRLYFNSALGLVPADANARMDVYEFEPNGIGSCKRPSGCIGLISSGEAGGESAFLDASSSGEDVFFMTGGKLVSADSDSAFDIYDAHVCSTGVPCPTASVSVPAACESVEACRTTGAPPARVAVAPPSALPSGAGNLTPSRPVVHQLSRAQKLKRALAACRRRPKRRRPACVTQAKRRYGTLKRTHKQQATSKNKRGH